jgi:S-adenosylmethionine decarboxylase
MDGNFVGRHLILDVKVSTLRGITEVSYIYNFLENLAKILDMTLVYPPIVGRFPWGSNDLEKIALDLETKNLKGPEVDFIKNLFEKRNYAAGVSGISIWLESHAAIHTWVNEKFFSFDAYSCKDFDSQKVIGFILEQFDIGFYNGLDVVRTVNEPQIIKILKNNFDS